MIAIVDYKLGNLRSVQGALTKLGFESVVTNSINELAQADKLILPGVGAFGDGMRNLRELDLIEPLTDLVVKKKKPILGICLGSQLMTNSSNEFGMHEGLGWVDADVRKFEIKDNLRVPHVGWNDLIRTQESVLYDGIAEDTLFYYVHSYRIQCHNKNVVIGECEYGEKFVAAYNQDNIFGTQFHPEKSQKAGLAMLNNFLTKVSNVTQTSDYSLNV